METNSPSVFDLSPPEKLQLVEDLWDYLAATPAVVRRTIGNGRN